ncbi:hypothetical protein [Leeuwenhoekiella sp. MAR_2009_132]|uniref:hypothetical protein n=1 Tax=Leeuwenhoekiella sp. MAR_2009_132 TaxID=1392489 RepID=UPI00048C0494|nr:hypothetical protein [Leeuwenhoekiella sp. MAR_2009_132]
MKIKELTNIVFKDYASKNTDENSSISRTSIIPMPFSNPSKTNDNYLQTLLTMQHPKSMGNVFCFHRLEPAIAMHSAKVVWL